jgi:hypothetical protein
VVFAAAPCKSIIDVVNEHAVVRENFSVSHRVISPSAPPFGRLGPRDGKNKFLGGAYERINLVIKEAILGASGLDPQI